MNTRKRTASLLGLVLLGWCVHAGAASFTLTDLGQVLGGVKQSQARFVETKTMALLERPLRLQGTLYFRAPDYVRKEVTAPDYEDYEIDGDQVRVQQADGRSRTIRLDAHPALRAFAEAFRDTLRGDFDALQRYYDLQLSGTRDDWQLTMVPRDESVAAQVRRIEVHGNGPDLFSVRIVERDGDESLMRMRTVEP